MRPRATAALLVAVLVLPAVATAQPAPAAEALAYLRRELSDPLRRQVTLVALQAARDPHLVPFFRALSRSDDVRERLQAVQALGSLAAEADAPDDRVAALQAALRDDPATAVRTEALSALLELDAVSTDELQALLGSGNEPLECLAARALVRQDRGAAAVEPLRKLTGSADRATACLARLTLLRLGYADQADPLTAAMLDADTPASLVAALLEEIAQEQIDAALPAVQAALRAGPRVALPYAYKALAALSPDGARLVREAIDASDQTVYRARLLSVLADAPAAQPELEALARGHDAVAELARFELARAAGDPHATGESLAALLGWGHPVLVEYALAAAREDLRTDPAAARPYAAPLLTYVRSVPADVEEMGPDHRLAAGAARFLVRLGTPEALAGLEQILAGPYDAVSRSVAAGLLRSVGADVSGEADNGRDPTPAVRSLMRPLLSSPNAELRTDAALALGSAGDPAAAAQLTEAIRRPGRHPPALSALAAWYLLTIHDQGARAGEDLADALAGPVR